LAPVSKESEMTSETRSNSPYAAAVVAAAGLATPVSGDVTRRVITGLRDLNLARRNGYQQTIAQALSRLESSRQKVTSLPP